MLSSADGSYAAGPLYDDEDYAVSAQGEGYHFKEESPGNFRALKLGKINIQSLLALFSYLFSFVFFFLLFLVLFSLFFFVLPSFLSLCGVG